MKCLHTYLFQTGLQIFFYGRVNFMISLKPDVSLSFMNTLNFRNLGNTTHLIPNYGAHLKRRCKRSFLTLEGGPEPDNHSGASQSSS